MFTYRETQRLSNEALMRAWHQVLHLFLGPDLPLDVSHKVHLAFDTLQDELEHRIGFARIRRCVCELCFALGQYRHWSVEVDRLAEGGWGQYSPERSDGPSQKATKSLHSCTCGVDRVG
jgi:hypothetical protein